MKPVNGAILARQPLAAPAPLEIWALTYWSDGLAVQGLLVQPRAPGLYPAVIYNRGGIGAGGAVTPELAVTLLARIAAAGYVVLASQYRGTFGSAGADEFGGADVSDVLNLLPLLDGLANVDRARIGMWGWSRGGLMAYRVLALTTRIAAAVIVAGVADAFDYMLRRPDMEREVFAQVIPGYAQERELALTTRSALRWPERLSQPTPLLLLHGSADWRVHPSQSLRMASALIERQRTVRLVIFEGGDHALSAHADEVLGQGLAWLARYV
jgi:dipeptidyl aminopeptidase/acylaminoacyl peptidase